jgi:hypothetical protein
MDTVHSSRESKRVILTFFLTREKLFLAFVMNRCTKGAVSLIFDKLERQMGTHGFLEMFHTILTDRGGEFGDPTGWRPELMASSAPAFITVIQCVVGKKEVLSRLIQCSE